MTADSEESDWFGHRSDLVGVAGPDGNRIPCRRLRPSPANDSMPWVLAVHGATSSKHEWTELDGYTKGGNLALALLDAGIALVAPDLRYHGENSTREFPGFDIFEEWNWPRFHEEAVRDLHAVIAHFAGQEEFDPGRMGFAGYSMGSSFGFWLANRGIPFKALSLCVPYVDRTTSTAYSNFNNLENLGQTPVLQISAQDDEYIPFDQARWLFERNPSRDKQFLSYPTGHSLPVDYVVPAAEWIKARI